MPSLTTAIGWGQSWAWRYESTAPDPAWTQAYDDSLWARGMALLGFGSSDVAETIHDGAASTRPLSAQFRSTFEVPDPDAASQVSIEVIANDGVVVYLNGQEVGRRNLPEGTIRHTTYATAAPLQAAAATSPLRIVVPASALQPGTNVLAAQTHLNYRSTRDVGFDARVALIHMPAG